MRAFLAYFLMIVLGIGTTADAGTNITFNGSSYTVPAVGDASWGTNVSTYLIAISNGALQKSGGTFTLTNEVDTGATYGIKMPYLKTETSVPATAGFVRAAKTDTIDWRNNANGANLALGINGSDRLQFNSIVVPGISTTDTLTNKTMDGGSNTFTNLPTSGLTGIVAPANGGTGIANNAASTLAISGNFATTLTVSGVTGVTLPTTGTLATRAGSETLTNKTISGASNTLTVRLASDVSGTLPVGNIAGPASSSVEGYLASSDWAAFNSIARVKATGTVNGYLSSSDWTQFNSGVTGVKASATANGYLSSTDWTAFNSGIVTSGTQTFAGAKTFSEPITLGATANAPTYGIRHSGTNSLDLYTNSTIGLTIDSSGNPSLGSSGSTTNVVGKIQAGGTLSGTAIAWFQTGGTTSSDIAADFRNGSNAQVFAVRGNGQLTVSSASWGTGGTAIGVSAGLLTTSPSSLRYKRNVADLSNEIDTAAVYKLRPVTFDYKVDGRHSFGFIAEEVEKVVPSLVNLENDEKGVPRPESVSYDHLSVLLLEEIKKLNQRISQLEAKAK